MEVKELVYLVMVTVFLFPGRLRCSEDWQGAGWRGGGGVWRQGKTSRVARTYGMAWTSWQATHNKSYATSNEGLERYVVWRTNTAYIQYHNSYSQTFGFTLAMNSFGDLTREEYMQNMRCVESTPNYPSFSATPPGRVNVTMFDGSVYSMRNLPNETDWRTEGVVTAVKDQGRCKSCYAFAITAAIESMHGLATGELVSLSEQNIVDCSIPYGNRGCSGGSRMSSVMYMVDKGGLDTTSAYPYLGRQYLCMFDEEAVGSGCTGVVRITRGNERDLMKAVAVVGPVTVAVDSRHTSFQFYSRGVYSEPGCSRSKLTHTLLVVGYGSWRGRDYWLLKNSWGTSWGRDGYIMMTRNYANQCGIASKAMYITI